MLIIKPMTLLIINASDERDEIHLINGVDDDAKPIFVVGKIGKATRDMIISYESNLKKQTRRSDFPLLFMKAR
jgi:hypothetical protein